MIRVTFTKAKNLSVISTLSIVTRISLGFQIPTISGCLIVMTMVKLGLHQKI